jgi:hypothetical protein
VAQNNSPLFAAPQTRYLVALTRLRRTSCTPYHTPLFQNPKTSHYSSNHNFSGDNLTSSHHLRNNLDLGSRLSEVAENIPLLTSLKITSEKLQHNHPIFENSISVDIQKRGMASGCPQYLGRIKLGAMFCSRFRLYRRPHCLSLQSH